MLAALRFLADDDDPFGIIIACFFMVVIVACGAYAVVWLRKRYWGGESEDVPHAGFTLGDLRQLHKSGRISDQEFELAKAKIVEAARRAAERAAPSANAGPRNQQGRGQ
jgi:hypothetical protein